LRDSRLPFVAAGLCILAFIAAQTFQSLAYSFWIPPSHDLQSTLLSYTLPVDQLRSLAVMGSILLLIIPYSVIALMYRRTAPLASLLGLIFGAAFVACEVSSRTIDFFVVGQRWAQQLQRATTAADHQLVLSHFELWNAIMRAWYFPLLLAHLLCSCCFLMATWRTLGPL
jgi:hypothetical protein